MFATAVAQQSVNNSNSLISTFFNVSRRSAVDWQLVTVNGRSAKG